MIQKKACIAMLLAGGEGRRMGFLTKELAKPAVHFGGKYRIIDFTLSNCANSGIYTVGVLTQYKPLVLNSHIGSGIPWDLDRKEGGVTILPPFVREKGGKWYRGTANAVFQNLYFIEQHNPRYVLILSGDHIYKMDYSQLMKYHQEKNADITIAVIEVPWKDASRFGVMHAAEDGRITDFEEKPRHPRSNLASMGVYLFNRKLLIKYLKKDESNPLSHNDFGMDVIPLMLQEQCRIFAYPFSGYWRDVGTVESLWEANMDLLADKPALDLHDYKWRIYSVDPCQPPHYLADTACVEQSLVSEGCSVRGTVRRTVLFTGVHVGEGSIIEESVIMPNVRIGRNVHIRRAIIDEDTVIKDSCRIFSNSGAETPQIILVEEKMIIQENSFINR